MLLVCAGLVLHRNRISIIYSKSINQSKWQKNIILQHTQWHRIRSSIFLKQVSIFKVYENEKKKCLAQTQFSLIFLPFREANLIVLTLFSMRTMLLNILIIHTKEDGDVQNHWIYTIVYKYICIIPLILLNTIHRADSIKILLSNPLKE